MNTVGTSASGVPLVLSPDGDNYECGAVGGIRIGRGNRRIMRDFIPMPICPPQVPQAAVVGSRRLMAIAMPRSCCRG
jgi:hypothetical protein